MDKLSFKQKLWLPLIISLIALLSISLFNAFQARNIRIEERKSDLINVTQVALSVVKQYAAQAQSGRTEQGRGAKTRTGQPQEHALRRRWLLLRYQSE